MHSALKLEVESNISNITNFTWKRNTMDIIYLRFSKPIDNMSHGSLLAIYLLIKG